MQSARRENYIVIPYVVICNVSRYEARSFANCIRREPRQNRDESPYLLNYRKNRLMLQWLLNRRSTVYFHTECVSQLRMKTRQRDSRERAKRFSVKRQIYDQSRSIVSASYTTHMHRQEIWKIRQYHFCFFLYIIVSNIYKNRLNTRFLWFYPPSAYNCISASDADGLSIYSGCVKNAKEKHAFPMVEVKNDVHTK